MEEEQKDGNERRTKKQKTSQKLTAFEAMRFTSSTLGKGNGNSQTAGVVKCPLCCSSQKVFTPGRGLRMHLNAKHSELDEESMCKALMQAEANGIIQKKSSKRRELDAGLKAAQDGDLNKLKVSTTVQLLTTVNNCQQLSTTT